MMKILFLVLAFLASGSASALSFNGQTCNAINVTPQLVVTCDTGQGTTTTITTPTAPIASTPSQPSSAPSCTLTGSVGIAFAGMNNVNLSVSCNVPVASYAWSEPSCLSTSPTCSVLKFTNKVYSVTGITDTGIKIPSNKIAL